MTMDIARQEREAHKMSSPRIAGDNHAMPSVKPSVKRPFDVAFLMLPDEKLKNRQQQAEKQLRLSGGDAMVTYPTQISVRSDESLRGELSEKRSEQIIGGGGAIPPRNFATSPNFMHTTNHNNNEIMKSGAGHFCIRNGSPSPRMYDDPTVVPHELFQRVHEMPRSAFTKVPHNSRQESPLAPPPQSLSPGQLSCPSNSPPVSSSPPRNIVYHNFRPEYQFMNASPFHTISQMQQIAQNQQKFKQQFVHRPPPASSSSSHNLVNGANGLPRAYLPTAGFPFAAANSHPFVAQPDLTGIVRNPAAAALLTTLIPPTIATSFTLTAQNVCAKCNISFRKFPHFGYTEKKNSKLIRTCCVFSIRNDQRSCLPHAEPSQK